MNYQKDFNYEMWESASESLYPYYSGIKDLNLERHSNKTKSRHFSSNGLSSTNSLQQQQFSQQQQNDARNIYNNPYTPPQPLQQQQQQHRTHLQLSQQHGYKPIIGNTLSSNNTASLNPYDYSSSSLATASATAASLAAAEQQLSLPTEADNAAFLPHNNGFLLEGVTPSAPPDVPPRNPTMSRMNNGRLVAGNPNDLDFEPSCLVRTPSGNVYIPSGTLNHLNVIRKHNKATMIISNLLTRQTNRKRN